MRERDHEESNGHRALNACRRSVLRGAAAAVGGTALGINSLSGAVAADPPPRNPGTTPVFPSDIGETFFSVAQAGNGSFDFVEGPGKAPFGSGSVQLTTTGTADRQFLYNYDWGTYDVETDTESNEGVALADVTELSYRTYGNDDTLQPALKTEIDPTGPESSGDDYATLNFEPYYNHAVTPGVWQTWDVLSADAGLWLTGVSGESSISDPVTWDRLLKLYPDASIRFGFGVGAGSGWGPFVGHVDDLRIGIGGKTTRYNFEARGKSGNGP